MPNLKPFNNPMPTVPDDRELGVAFSALTAQRRAFVLEYIAQGGQDMVKIALAAGYGGHSTDPRTRRDNAQVNVYRLMRRADIMAAIREVIHDKNTEFLAPSQKVVMDILVGAIPGTASEKLRAAQYGFAINGMAPIVKQEIKVERVDREATIKEIAQLAKDLGVPIKQLVGRAADIVEADFTDVTDRESHMEDMDYSGENLPSGIEHISGEEDWSV